VGIEIIQVGIVIERLFRWGLLRSLRLVRLFRLVRWGLFRLFSWGLFRLFRRGLFRLFRSGLGGDCDCVIVIVWILGGDYDWGGDEIGGR
jgi:hypothetical protein